MPADDRYTDPYRRALDLVAAGRHEPALACLQEHLLAHPTDAEALNDAGVVLHALGRLDEAVGHLQAAVRHARGRAPAALATLAEVHLAQTRPDLAAALFDDLAEAGAWSPDLANRAAAQLIDRRDAAGALELLIRSLQRSCDQPELPPILDKIRQVRPKIAFLASPGRSLLPTGLAEFLDLRFETRRCGDGPRDLADAIEWADVLWFQGCEGQAAAASQLPKARRLVVHVEATDVYGRAVEQVVWPRVDVLIVTGSRHLADVVARQVPSPPAGPRIERLGRTIDLPDLPRRRRRGRGDLACVGDVSLAANPMLLLHCLRQLRAMQPGVRLFFAGYFHDDLLEPYLRKMVGELGLAEAVFFDGWPEDLSAWLADKDFAVSAAVAEGCEAGAATAMALGLKPVVHAFPGAEDLYPRECLYRTPEEFCRIVGAGAGEPARWRDIIRENGSPQAAQAEVNRILCDLERTMAPIRPASDARASAPRAGEEDTPAGGSAPPPGRAASQAGRPE